MNSYRRTLTPPAGSFFLFGVRGVGKSTWARAAFPGAHVVDLLDEARHHTLLADPSLLGAELAALPPTQTVVLDEIQRVPALLNEVHRAIEANRRRFVLLGSSARRLKTAGTNLLAGRAALETMFPLVPHELGAAFDLARILRFGSIPVIWQSADPRAALDAYVQLYLREEIRAEALARNLPAFLRFLPVAALCHGQTVNVSGLARDAATSRTTIDGYLGILEDTLVANRLPAYEARLRVRERSHPKLYWVDPGLARAARRHLDPVGPDEKGPLMEGWVFTLLRAHNQGGSLFDEVSYWAPAQARFTEVDFLLRRGRDFLALEVKSSSRLNRSMLTGLQAISDLPRVKRRVLLYLGSQRLKTDEGIEVWPLQVFLDQLATGRLWPS